MELTLRFQILIAVGGLLGSFALPACTSPDNSSESTDSPDSSATAVSAPMPRSTSANEAPPASPSSSSRTVSQQLADATVEARTKRALARERPLRVFNFRLEAMDGHVTIHGDVNTREQYQHAERVARSVEGVESVTNELTVGGQPVGEAEESESPSGTESSTEPDAVYHTVRNGDTLWEIAQEYGTSIQRIRNLNDVSSGLHPGQRIRVR